MSTKGIGKVVTMVTSLGRKVVKATPVLIPAGTIVANIADIAATSPDAASALQEFIKRYSGIDFASGTFDGGAFLKGSGALIVTGLIGKIVKDLV